MKARLLLLLCLFTSLASACARTTAGPPVGQPMVTQAAPPAPLAATVTPPAPLPAATAANAAALPPPPTPTALLAGPYAVVNVARKDTLNLRKEPNSHAPVVERLAHDTTNLLATGREQGSGSDRWMELVRPRGNGTGWVNALYLTEYVVPQAFCADPRVPVLLEQFTQAMTRRDGKLLSSLIGPDHDLSVTYFRTGNKAGYSRAEAGWLFNSTYKMNWGTHPASGLEVSGSFQDKVLPDLLDVLANPHQTLCNNPATGGKSYTFEWPPMYRNINFYALYKPGPAGQELAWRTWLVGVEYVQGQPYLFALMQLFWEP